ncbi:hypothetical protein F4860DRAFT_471217 [Xylaria cubensis]|nr:hypothetical protein F4860DRAFT_471217 [Xylaria cubensis]
MDQDHIDSLLERYLHLLHEYTSLRDELATLQMGMYQNIARANFAAERGLRFGQDYYDDRMQASRRLAISYQSRDQAQDQSESESRDRRDPTVLSGVVPSFTVISPAAAACVSSLAAEDSKVGVETPDSRPHPEAEVEADSVEQSAVETTKTEEASSASTPSSRASMVSKSMEDAEATTSENSVPVVEEGRATQQKSNDPIRWFGLLTPVPLRQAQTQSIRVIEHVIPRLASVNVEMAEVEIEVRRARKRRAKAAAAAIRLSQQGGQEQEVGARTEGSLTSDICA